MKHPSNKVHNQKSSSNSSSPNSRSRSRSESPNPHSIKESKQTDNTRDRHRNIHNQILKPDEGKLYLANIPINIPQQRIKQEFEKYGKILDYKFYKKTEVANPYYYGHITLSKKNEAELAMNNLTKEYNWTVKPYNRNEKEKNKERNLNNLNNNISNLNNLNKINNNTNSSLPQNDENNNNINGGTKVREIFVGNLPMSLTETDLREDLYKEFFIFGEISKIELKTIEDKRCAYIKYRLINSAMKAIEKNDKMNFKGNIINVSLSNISQRRDIKGNELGYELHESNCKLIVVCLNKNMNSTNEENASNIFEKFGKIKMILIKNMNNRTHIFAEYYKPEHAKLAIDELNKDTKIKALFGDENCEINYYFKNKWNEINPIISEQNDANNTSNINTNMNYENMNKNINNSNNIYLMNKNIMMQKMGMNNPALLLKLMQMQQQLLLNNQLNINNPNQINDLNPLNNLNNSINPNNIINSYNTPINQIQPNINMPFPSNTRIPFYPNLTGYNLPQNNRNFSNPNPNFQLFQVHLNNPTISNVTNNNSKNQINVNNMNNQNMNNMIPNYIKENMYNNNNNANNDKNKTNEVNNILNQILSNKNNQKNSNTDSDISSINGSHQSAEEMEFEKEYSLEGENIQLIWSGFLTKNSKDRTNVDMYKIRGNIDDSTIKEISINVCNRISYEEVMKKRELGLVAISPQSITQKDNFDSFINYLNEKQRCGVINLSGNKYILYLVSPGEFSQKFYINPKKHLLGIFVDTSLDTSHNQLTIPPPVISLTEKRRLMNKNKKNENNKKIKDSEQDKIMVLKEQLKKFENNGDEEGIKNMEELIKQNPDFKDILDKL